MNDKTLSAIQQIYKSDIRSMLNCIQSNMDVNNKYYIIEEIVWEKLFHKIQDHQTNAELISKKQQNILHQFEKISKKYNYEKARCVLDFLNYIIRNKSNVVTSIFLDFVTKVSHYTGPKNNTYIQYVVVQLIQLLENK